MSTFFIYKKYVIINYYKEVFTLSNKKSFLKERKFKIAMIIIFITVLISLTPIGIKFYNESKNEMNSSIKNIQEELTTTETEQGKVLLEEGFSKNYYELAEKIDGKSTELMRLKTKKRIIYTIIPIIVLGSIILIGSLIMIGNIIADSFRKIPINQTDKSKNIFKKDNQKVVLHIIDRSKPENIDIKPLKCPSCKANLTHHETKCEYCGTNIVKTKK